MVLTKEQLLDELVKIKNTYEHDLEVLHSKADDLLLEYINDGDIKKAYTALTRWYV